MFGFLRRHALWFSATLVFASTILLSIWVNLFTSNTSSPAYHLLLASAVILFLWQLRIVRGSLSAASKQHAKGSLRLGVLALARYAGRDPKTVRAFVHEVGHRGLLRRRRCLVKLASYSQISPQDTGPIEIDIPEHKRWFFNVHAFTSKQISVGNIDWNNVPQTGGRAPSVNKSILSVLSFPIVDNETNDPIGTLTFDAQATAENMKWLDANGNTPAEVEEMVAEIRTTVLCLMLNLEPDSI